MTHQSGTRDESEKMKMKTIKRETRPPSNLLPPFCIAGKFVFSNIFHICNTSAILSTNVNSKIQNSEWPMLGLNDQSYLYVLFSA